MTKVIIRDFGLNLLFLTFLNLKLSKNINWSWWLVFSPLLVDWGVHFIFNFIKTWKETS